MKNGTETNVWARITARVVNGMAIPKRAKRPPRNPCARTPGAARARPRTAAARSAGRSRPPTGLAAEPAARQHHGQRQAEPDREDQADGRGQQAERERVEDDRVVRARAREPSMTARTTSAATGRPRNSAASAAMPATDHAPAERRASARRRPASSASAGHGRRGRAWRARSLRRQEPERGQDRLAIRTGEPGQECRPRRPRSPDALTTTPAYVAGTLARGGHVDRA